MRALRTCDFCGGDAAGTFEVIPPEFEPTDAEQRRVVLCPDCKATLEDVLEPLFARLDDDKSAATATERPADRTARGATDGAVDEASAEGDADRDSVDGDGSSQPRTETTDSNATRSAVDADDNRPTPELEGGITFDAADAAATSESSAGDATTGNDEQRAETPPSESDTEPTEADSSAETTTATTAGQTTRRTPTGYGKVLRLLQNREFPMARSAVEGLAAGAYDLESEEVDAIIEHALEDGEFIEERGELRRP